MTTITLHYFNNHKYYYQKARQISILLLLFVAYTTPTTAQTFAVQTGANHPLYGVDLGEESAPTFVDIDNDGDFDAFSGSTIGNINYYQNTGTNAAPIFVKQTGSTNPVDGINVGNGTKPTFIDIDNDGDFDVFIGVQGSFIHHYENTGTATVPVFTAQTGSNNPCDGIIVSGQSSLTFTDIDNDGDFDIFTGEFDGEVKYYKNTGTNAAPVFTAQTGSHNPFDGIDVGFNSRPTFIDIDNDGDFDSFIGEFYGTIKYYENTGTNAAPIFTEQTGVNNPFDGVDVGFNSKPTFIDIDNDGDFDAFIGEYNGHILFYENTGTATTPVFTKQVGANNPFYTVDVGTHAKPTFVDIDNDGDFDVFIGEQNGFIYHYENTGTNISPVFTPQIGANNPFDGINPGLTVIPTFVDIDNDGDFDAFIGEASNSTIKYYENTGTDVTPTFTEQTGVNNPLNSVSVSFDPNPTFVDIDNDGDFDLFVGESDGSIDYYENTGTNQTPIFTAQTGINNPFDGVDVGSFSYPTFVDVDNDGDFDAFIGESDGTIHYYKNTGTNQAPTFTIQTGVNNPFDGVDVGNQATPIFVDIDNDGDFDAFIGKSDGTLDYYQNTTALPVELTYFKGEAISEDNLLTWQTASEESNKGFEVQRSQDGVNWEALGFVDGNGTTLEIQNYAFTDYQPLNGRNYYRLKQIDFDGAYEYSEIINIIIESSNHQAIQLFPNPVKEQFTIQGISGRLFIYNLLGQPLYMTILTESNSQIPINNFVAGQYLVVVVSEDGRKVTKRIVKQ